MPKLGERCSSKQLGFKSNCSYVWTECNRCGMQRWVRSVTIKRMGGEYHCNKCKLSEDKVDSYQKNRYFDMWDGADEPKVGQVCHASMLNIKARVYMVFSACPECGDTRWTYHSCVNKICKNCWYKQQGKRYVRETHPLWKGGKSIVHGYVRLLIDSNHPFYCMATKRGAILEHRLIMAQYLGRPLERWEIVHHKNQNKSDNRIENLELLPSPSAHAPLTLMESRIGMLEKRVIKLEAENVLLRSWIELQGKESNDILGNR